MGYSGRAIDRARGRNDQMLAGGDLQRFKQVERADDIGIEIGPRVFGAVSHAGLGGEVDDDVGRRRTDAFGEARAIFQHHDLGVELRKGAQDLVSSPLKSLIVVGRDAVDADDCMALGQQAMGHMEADETGGACNQIAHGLLLGRDEPALTVHTMARYSRCRCRRVLAGSEIAN